jgi:flagellar hook-basal body complex protein FliE
MKGIAPLNNIEPLLNPAIREKQSEGEVDGSFAGIIKQAMNDVNQAKLEADRAIHELATGDKKDIHQTMIALEKAEVSFQLMMQVRNKIVSAYEEIMRMQV